MCVCVCHGATPYLLMSSGVCHSFDGVNAMRPVVVFVRHDATAVLGRASTARDYLTLVCPPLRERQALICRGEERPSMRWSGRRRPSNGP